MKFTTLPSPLWVLGTDTNVGKTRTAALIARAWAAEGPVVYRKPFQSGVSSSADPGSDGFAVAGPGIQTESWVDLRAPLSPLAAAEVEGRRLDLEAAKVWVQRPSAGRLLLEGVGGLMVPLDGHTHFLAWATDLGIPAVLVARGGLGTLNHVLLSAEALMLRGWRIPAILLNPGLDATHAAAEGNAKLLRRFLPIPVEVLK